MKTKIVKVSCRLKEDSLAAVQDILDSMDMDLDVEMNIEIENEDKSKLKASYEYEDSELSGAFFDEEICEDITTVSMAAIMQGNLYFCKGKVVNMQLTGGNQRVLLDLEVPLVAQEDEEIEDNAAVPAPLSTPQTYTPIPATPELQKYEAKIVGIRHNTTEATYTSLVSLSQNRGSVLLRPEPDNEKDPMAVAVFLPTGEKVGYIATDYLPVIRREAEVNADLTAEVTYMEYEGSTATILLKIESDIPVMAVQLFSRYTPEEVYKSSYVHRAWGGKSEKEEEELFSKDTQSIHFIRFSALPINTQNRIAAEWEYRMNRATVDNPTNPGLRMTVPLDLSVYKTSWKQLDLSNQNLIQFIELDNKMLAIYVRARRTDHRWNVLPVETFLEENGVDEVGEELMKRMRFEFDNKRC